MPLTNNFLISREEFLTIYGSNAVYVFGPGIILKKIMKYLAMILLELWMLSLKNKES